MNFLVGGAVLFVFTYFVSLQHSVNIDTELIHD